jgi:hypothetical protein
MTSRGRRIALTERSAWMCYGELSGEVFQVCGDQLFPPKQSLDGAPGVRAN